MLLFSTIDEAKAEALAIEINTSGFAKLERALSADTLQHIRSHIETRAACHHGQYFAYHGEQALAGSLLAELVAEPAFKALLARIYFYGAGRAAHSEQIFPVLRCVQGLSGLKESNCFHYDATLLTVLVPICIPHEERGRGDLMIFANLRHVRATVLQNIIDKALVQNALSRRLITWAIQRGWLTPKTLPLMPGTIYFFWGYRSLHANQPCSPDFRRATALLHFGDPHAASFATRLILRLTQRRARRVIAQADSTRS